MNSLNISHYESNDFKKEYHFLIIGFGSVGRRHTRNIKKTYPKNKIFLISKTSSNLFKEEKFIYKRIRFEDLKYIKNKIIVFICNTPNLHLKTARKFINSKYSIFIEKPISSDLKGLHNFISVIKKNKIVCHLGYQFRYHPLILKVKKIIDSKKYGVISSVQMNCSSYLPNWRDSKNYKDDISANKRLGGGALLELSHEIDYAFFLFGNFKKVFSDISNTNFLDIDTEESIDLILSNKLFNCNIHLDFHSYQEERFLKINFEKASIKVDFILNKMIISKQKKTQEFKSDINTHNSLFFMELKDFVKNVKKNIYSNQTLIDSYNVMNIINSCKKSHKNKKYILL